MSDAETQRYTVHAADEGRHQSHTVEGTSFEDAAFAFVERWAPAPDADGDVAVIVQEIESGARHCFRIDLGSGEAAPLRLAPFMEVGRPRPLAPL